MCIWKQCQMVLPLCALQLLTLSRDAPRAGLAGSGAWCCLQAPQGLGFWLQLLSCCVAGCAGPKSPRGEVCCSPTCGACLLQPGCSCRCWRGFGGHQAHLAAAHQGLHPKPTNVMDGLPLSHQPNPATEKTAGKTPID